MNFLTLFSQPNLIAAHRGDRSLKPENTLSALKSSRGKCDFIEIDVQLSRDLVPVIIHDDTLGRTSNVRDIDAFGKRYPWRVRDFSCRELQLLDYGSWFYKEDPFGCIKAKKIDIPTIENRKEALLTLEKALMFAKEEQMYLNVEIKDMHRWLPDRKVVAIVADLIKKLQAEPLVLLSSFHHDYLPICRELLPDTPVAALTEGKIPDNFIDRLGILQADACHLDGKHVDKDTVKRLRDAGYVVNVYTVNEPKRIEELFEWGVNAVFTDLLSSASVGV